MMKKVFFGVVCFLWTASALWAQSKPYQKSSLFGTKLLFLEYNSLNGGDEISFKNGIELSYGLDVSQRANISFPITIGLIKVPEDLNNRNIVGIDGLFQFKLRIDTARIIPYVMAGLGVVNEETRGANMQIPLGGGLSIRVGDQSFLNFQGAFRISSDENRHNINLGMGYTYRFRKLDKDRDGVVDHLDDCPEIAGLAITNGCPDKDGDGIADEADQCPEVPGRRSTDGCPDQDRDGVPDHLDPCPEEVGNFDGCPDSDGDGVADHEDECPDQRGIIAMNGCPDSDGDGVSDIKDECPNEVGIIANKGCPQQDTDGDGVADEADLCPDLVGKAATNGCPDADGDGVADKDDRCPEKPGPFSGCPDTDGDGVIDADDGCPDQSGPADNGGCPELEAEEKEVLEFAKRAVQFETGQATLLPESYDVLDQIVQIMNRYPGYLLRISGHTDDVGQAGINQDLSERRAAACYNRIVASGVSAERISYVGYGELEPIADNSTAEGRSLNRRVEFELYIDQ